MSGDANGSFPFLDRPLSGRRGFLVATTSLGLVLASGQASHAQDLARSMQTPVAASDAFMLGPVTVTSRKLTETQQEVPLSVTVADEEAMRDRRIDTVESLLREVPGIGFSSLGDGRSTFLSVRGIGPMSQPLGYDDTSTVTYIDGVPQPLFGSDLSLVGVERVEVMRGAQGTVFGRNAQAGAINIVTRKPGGEPEFSIRTEIGTDFHRLGQLSGSGPLVKDKLSGGLTLSYSGIDGDVENRAPGTGDLGDVENWALRGSLVATPGPDTRLTLGLSAQKDRNRPANFLLRNQPDFPVVAVDPEGGIERRLAGVSLTAEHDFRDMTLTSVSAFNHYGYTSLSNNSEALTFSKVFGMPTSAFLPATDVSSNDERLNSVYQELRLSSAPDATVSWVGGLSYYHDTYRLTSIYGSAFFPSTNGTRHHRYSTDSYAGFGEATVPVPGIAGLKATAGLRYTHDDKSYDARHISNGFHGTAPSHAQSGTLGFDLLTGRAALSYELATDSIAYASVSRGAKSGGFPNFTNNAPTGSDDKPYREATSWSYEVGMKNHFLDRSLMVNVALYRNAVTDEQLTALDSASFAFVPKSIDTRTIGAEIEVGYRLMPGLDLLGSAAWSRGEVRNASADVAASSGAVDGNRVPGAPNFTGSVSLQYRGAADWLGLGDRAGVLALAQYQHVGTRAADVGNHFTLDAYNIVNLKAGLEFGNLDIYAFARNLTDDRPQYLALYYGPGAEAVTVGHGRVVGIGAQMRF